MRVGIVGAGIGGLATAIGLTRAGIDVTVFERHRTLTAVGSGLSLFANGRAALTALGLAESATRIGASAPDAPGWEPPAGQRRPDGRWLAQLPPAAKRTVSVVHRADLHRILLSALPADVVRVGQVVKQVSPDGRTIDLGSNSEAFDVVVAADGIRSQVRVGWPTDPGVRYAGYLAWRGVTEHPVDVSSGSGETLGRGLRFGIAPLADGRVYWFGVVSAPAGTPPPGGPELVTELFGGWHKPIAELVATTPSAEIQALPIEELAANLPSYRRGRCVLLGDAAHAMTPNLGQGGNQALEDAVTLAALLGAVRDDTGIDAALVEYDRLRRPRSQRIARQARLLGQVLQARSAIACTARDAMLRLTPTRIVTRSLLSVQKWESPLGRQSGDTGAI